jgi:hypothetical protein
MTGDRLLLTVSWESTQNPLDGMNSFRRLANHARGRQYTSQYSYLASIVHRWSRAITCTRDAPGELLGKIATQLMPVESQVLIEN